MRFFVVQHEKAAHKIYVLFLVLKIGSDGQKGQQHRLYSLFEEVDIFMLFLCLSEKVGLKMDF